MLDVIAVVVHTMLIMQRMKGSRAHRILSASCDVPSMSPGNVP